MLISIPASEDGVVCASDDGIVRDCCCVGPPAVWWFGDDLLSGGAGPATAFLFCTDVEGNVVWTWQSSGEARVTRDGWRESTFGRTLARHNGYIYGLFFELHSNWNDGDFTSNHLVGKWDELTGELVATYAGFSSADNVQGFVLDLYDNGDAEPDIIIGGLAGDPQGSKLAAIKQFDSTLRWEVFGGSNGPRGLAHRSTNRMWVSARFLADCRSIFPSTGADTGSSLSGSGWGAFGFSRYDPMYRPDGSSNLLWVHPDGVDNEGLALIGDTGVLQYVGGVADTHRQARYLSADYFAAVAFNTPVRVYRHNPTAFLLVDFSSLPTDDNVVGMAVETNVIESQDKIFVGLANGTSPSSEPHGGKHAAIYSWDESTETLTLDTLFGFAAMNGQFGGIAGVVSQNTVT